MTPKDHNKVLGIMHLIWGGFNTLVTLIVYPFIIIIIREMLRSDPNMPPQLGTLFVAIIIAALVFSLLFSVPPLLAGYAMLKGKRWAKVAAIVAACFETLSMPFGTALAVYSLWFHFGPGQNYHSGGGFDAPPAPDWRGSLRDGSAYDWEAQRNRESSRPREYAPPKQPPDWRG